MSSSNKRAREVARAKAERQATRRAEESAKRRRRNQIIAVVAVLVVVAAGIGWFALNRSSSTPSADVTPTASPEATASPSGDSASASPSPEPTSTDSSSDSASPSPSPTKTNKADCSAPPSPRANDMTWPSAPEDTLKPNTDYTMTLKTNCGVIEIAMEAQQAPQTVNSMAFLSDQGYFNDTACHRLTTEGIFVLQCGDPAGDGTGGPGYSIPDENLPKEGSNDYPAGTVAMANAGPGTGGSQFFIVYADTTLPPDYTIWGTVTKGLDVVQAVAAAGVEGGGGDGRPAQPISILEAKVAAK